MGSRHGPPPRQRSPIGSVTADETPGPDGPGVTPPTPAGDGVSWPPRPGPHRPGPALPSSGHHDTSSSLPDPDLCRYRRARRRRHAACLTPSPKHAGGARRLVCRHPGVRRGGRAPGRCAPQRDDRAPRQGGRRGLVVALRRRRAAHALLPEQELHVDRRRPRHLRGPPHARRSRPRVLPRRRPRRPGRQPARHARPRPADDDDGAARGRHPRLPLRRRREPGEAVPRAAGGPQAGHAVRLQHAGHLHAVGDRAEGHGQDPGGLPPAAALRSARHQRTRCGRPASAASRWAASA